MKINKTILTSVLFLAGASITNTPLQAQGDCGGEASSYKLIVHVSEDRPTRVTHKGQDANDFYVCNGDQVEWQLVGSGKQFWLDFVNGAPFSGENRTNSNSNGKVSVVIDGAAQSYKYDIGIVDGGVLDPQIIIGD